jgi:release factor glutamine methyltransferase
MTTDEWLLQATQLLTNSDIPTARLDCLVLLEDCLHTDRAHILAHPETTLTIEQQKILDEHITKRTKHIPLAYIRGKTEFYGRDFIINKHVLEPRPETETMIDLLKELATGNWKLETIIDVGTGSGAIAITAALELGAVQVIATDIDEQCLTVARQNCEKYKATITLLQGNLLGALPKTINYKQSTILANLPYVPNDHKLNQAAMNEPKLAIFGGEDGLDLYRTMFTQIGSLRSKPAYVLTESLPFQHSALTKIASKTGYTQQTTNDFIQVFTLK